MFYSVVQENNIVGLRKQDGYEIEVDGIKFNAYKSMIDGRVYILDPKNGIAVFIYSDDTDVLSHHDPVEKAKDEFKKKFGRSPKVYDVAISDGARRLE